MKAYHEDVKTLSSKENISLLEENCFAHLGCYDKGEIYVVPITYALVEGEIYAHSKPGRKIDSMRRNSKICIQVEDIKDYFHWKSVIVWGKYEEVKGEESARAMRMLILKILQKETHERASSLEVDLTAQLEAAVIFKIKIEKITGRYEG